MNIFNELSYRTAIKNLLNSGKSRGKKYTMAALAEEMRVQPPYVTKVLKGAADFHQDQLYLLADYFELDSEEEGYLSLLLEYERSSIKVRKEKLLQKIRQIQEIKLSTEEVILTESPEVLLGLQAEYYMDPMNLIVHMALLTEEGSNLKKLSMRLGISFQRLQDIVSNLEKLGIVTEEGNKFKNKAKGLHLSPQNSLCSPHQLLLRQQTISFFQDPTKRESAYQLAITYTADHEAKEKIKALFLDFLKKADRVIDAAPSSNVYQMNFDLFPWLQED